jgi:hypothetical protein
MLFPSKIALSFVKMASSIMPIPTIRHQQAHLGRGRLPAVLLSVFATLAVITPVAIFFWPDNIDPRVRATFRPSQQQTTSGIEAINDRPAAEKFLAQTRGTKATNDSLAAEDQLIALSARLNTLQEAMTRILRDNAGLAQQLKATQAQMAQDNASVAEQLKAMAQNSSQPRADENSGAAGRSSELATAVGRDFDTTAALLSKTSDEVAQLRKIADANAAVLKQEPDHIAALQSRTPAAGAPVAAPPARKIDPDELATLINRAKILFASGDISPARLLLERAADAQEPTAALLLARTYDPDVLRTQNVRNILPDPAMARIWYQRAAQLGSADAQRRLAEWKN